MQFIFGKVVIVWESTRKNKLINEYKQHEKDTGSPEVQIAILSDHWISY
jgi:ribosomal protein S15